MFLIARFIQFMHLCRLPYVFITCFHHKYYRQAFLCSKLTAILQETQHVWSRWTNHQSKNSAATTGRISHDRIFLTEQGKSANALPAKASVTTNYCFSSIKTLRRKCCDGKYVASPPKILLHHIRNYGRILRKGWHARRSSFVPCRVPHWRRGYRPP